MDYRFWLCFMAITTAVSQAKDISITSVLDIEAVASTGTTDEQTNQTADKTDINPFFYSMSANILSEFGDKTFIIAAIMATKYHKYAVLLGASAALVTMTMISCIIGQAMPWLFSTKYTHIIAGIGFLIFGGLMLYEAYLNKEDPEEEKELEEEIKKIDEKLLRSNSGHDIELQEKTTPTGTVVQKTTEAAPRLEHRLIQVDPKQIFYIAFHIGEWGDKSQISTVALAARYDALQVFFGASIGLSIVTALGVWGGKMIAGYVSERVLTLLGGLLFLFFGLTTLFSSHSD